jgi:hypothetical protein
VANFLGKRNLEVYTARLTAAKVNKRTEIRVFAVSSELYQVPAWECFEKVIKDALVDTLEKERDKIIRTLLDRVTSGKGLRQEARRSVIFFQKIVKEEMKTCSLIMHCEAVVAALLESRLGQPTVPSTDLESKDNRILAQLSEVLDLVPECNFFY